jgi:hypothetical protein
MTWSMFQIQGRGSFYVRSMHSVVCTQVLFEKQYFGLFTDAVSSSSAQRRMIGLMNN